jgi:L-ascorbate metabolism protein UlaG (beta-lactamase superfamily)
MTVLQFPEDQAADFSQGEVYFIGNATTLIRFGGLTILTDPAFMHAGTHTYLGYGIWARREVEPACQVGDHFDEAAARDLDQNLPVISTADAVAKLQSLGFRRGYALDPWQSHRVEKGQARLEITAVPAKHAMDDATAAMLMPVNGHVLEFSHADQELYRLYISGDTMPIDQLAQIPRVFPDIDLGLIHAGGTTLFLTVVTMTGEQAVRAVEMVRPRTAIPIHYNDYSVFRSGLDDFRQAAAWSSADTAFRYLAHGETYTFSSKVQSLGHPAR